MKNSIINLIQAAFSASEFEDALLEEISNAIDYSSLAQSYLENNVNLDDLIEEVAEMVAEDILQNY